MYVKSDTLLLADVFGNFRNKYIEIYELDPAYLLSCLKKRGKKSEFITDSDMLLMVENGIRSGICHAIHKHAKTNNNYMKNYHKSKVSSNLMYLDENDWYAWKMSQKIACRWF